MPKHANKTSFVARSLHESYTVDATTRCWQWVGSRKSDGYTIKSFKRNGKNTSMPGHRWVYEQIVGPIPAGLQLDHLCRNRGCVNPSHMEPVTPKTNNARKPDYDRNASAAWETKRAKGTCSSSIPGVSKNRCTWVARVPNNGKAYRVIGCSPIEEGAAYCLQLYRKEVPLAPL